MKVSKRDIGIILVLVGILAAFLAFQFSFRGNMDEADALKEECETLQKELDEVLAFGKNDEQASLAQISKWKNELNDLVASFPVRYTYEDAIMYLYDFEHREKDPVLFSRYSIVETIPIASLDLMNKVVDGKEVSYIPGLSTISADYSVAKYEDMLTFLRTIYSDTNPKNIENITMVFDPVTGIISGKVVINMYSLTDTVPNNEYSEPEIPSVPMQPEPGIFGPTVTPAPIVTEEPEE